MRTHRVAATALVVAATTLACIVLVACGHDATGTETRAPSPNASLAACAPGTAILTVPPIALADVGGWVPLGSVGPPAHTFPTDHQYVYLSTFTTPAAQHPVALVAPATGIVTRARRTTYSSDGHTDYSITFAPCREVAGEFGHVGTIAPALLAKLGPMDQRCESYTPNPGLVVATCYTASVSVPISAGDALGTVGGGMNTNSLDFTLWDTRVTPVRYANPTRWIGSDDGFDAFHIVAASDYFAEPVRSEVATKVGSFDGRVHRSMTPLGGTLALDVPGSAQGSWLDPSQPTHPETPHLSIVPDVVDSNTIVVALGLSQPGAAAGPYRFTPVSAGLVNLDPARIVADGRIYCDETQSGVLLLELRDATTLRVEMRPTARSCASEAPWTFTPGTWFDYKR